MTLNKRIKQFREYNNLKPEIIAEAIGVSLSEYESFEDGTSTPTIDIIKKLAKSYKVTDDEFLGYTPRLAVYDITQDFPDEDESVDDNTLKMADLSWDEAQIILYYRQLKEKDDIISEIIKRRNENK